MNFIWLYQSASNFRSNFSYAFCDFCGCMKSVVLKFTGFQQMPQNIYMHKDICTKCQFFLFLFQINVFLFQTHIYIYLFIWVINLKCFVWNSVLSYFDLLLCNAKVWRPIDNIAMFPFLEWALTSRLLNLYLLEG